MEQNEAALWERAREGDAESFAALFERHRDRVFVHALRLLGDVHDAEDVTAVSFLHLWRRRGDVRLAGDSVLPWLLVTTTNTTRNVRRSTRRYRELLSALPRSVHAASAEEEAVTASGFSPDLAAALSGLSTIDRHLTALVMLEGLPLSDAASVLNLTVAAAKTRLYRVRTRLRRDLTGSPLDRNFEVIGELS